MKDHLFIQSLEKEGQEWLRGESAIPAAQWGGQLETGRSLTHTRAPLAPSERKRGERNEREGRGGGGTEGGGVQKAERERERESKARNRELLVGDYLLKDSEKEQESNKVDSGDEKEEKRRHGG